MQFAEMTHDGTGAGFCLPREGRAVLVMDIRRSTTPYRIPAGQGLEIVRLLLEFDIQQIGDRDAGLGDRARLVANELVAMRPGVPCPGQLNMPIRK